MKPIVTLTLNPSLDASSFAETIRPLHKIRTSEERYHPRGGGVNVARVLLELGGSAHALYLAGGPTGRVLDDLLALAVVPAERVSIAGYTRVAHTVFERSREQEYRFVPDGPDVAADEWDRCLSALGKIDFDYLVTSAACLEGCPSTHTTGSSISRR